MGEDSKEMALLVLVSDEVESRESVEMNLCWPSPLPFRARSERRPPRRRDERPLVRSILLEGSMMTAEWSFGVMLGCSVAR